MDARSEELQETYTLDDLGRDSGIDGSLASKVMRGERRATREAIESWAKALRPHLDLDAMLMAAGHEPTDARKAGVFRELWRLTSEQWAQIERWVGERATPDESGKKGDKGDGKDEPAPKS